MYDKLVVITRKTRLQQLIERFNTRAQAAFFLTRAGQDFDDYQCEDDTYRRALDQLLGSLDLGLKLQVLDRALVSTYLFDERDVVVTAGQDGLVANTAKYVGAQPLLGVNPDPARFDGVLLPFSVAQARRGVERTLQGKAAVREVTLAEAHLSDGQRLLAFNELFVGMANHTSARYALRQGEGPWETQSSSGVLVSTGAGATGWLSSVFQMASAFSAFAGGAPITAPALAMNDPRLFFTVREPFVSRTSSAGQALGWLAPGTHLELESRMPQGGVIFSDGMESDALRFTSGVTVRIAAAKQAARLVLPQ
jgi:NAD kinase